MKQLTNYMYEEYMSEDFGFEDENFSFKSNKKKMNCKHKFDDEYCNKHKKHKK